MNKSLSTRAVGKKVFDDTERARRDEAHPPCGSSPDVGLAAGPAASHLYWLLGGTWGLYTHGVRDEVATTGVRVLAAIVLVLLVAAVLVVLARVGLWQQTLVSERVIRILAWALAAVFLLETLAAFTFSRDSELWWMYGPVSFMIAALALVVAGSGGAWPRLRRLHRARPSH